MIMHEGLLKSEQLNDYTASIWRRPYLYLGAVLMIFGTSTRHCRIVSKKRKAARRVRKEGKVATRKMRTRKGRIKK